MENAAYFNPKDEHITNDDNAVTNKDGDNNLEKGEHPIDQKEPDAEHVETVVSDNDNDDPGSPEKEEDPSNKDKGPKGENL